MRRSGARTNWESWDEDRTLGEIVTAVVSAGMEIEHLGEYPEPFWRPGGVTAAAWDRRLPNSFALLARRRVRDGTCG